MADDRHSAPRARVLQLHAQHSQARCLGPRCRSRIPRRTGGRVVAGSCRRFVAGRAPWSRRTAAPGSAREWCWSAHFSAEHLVNPAPRTIVQATDVCDVVNGEPDTGSVLQPNKGDRRTSDIGFVLATYAAGRLFYLISGFLLASVVPTSSHQLTTTDVPPGSLNSWSHWGHFAVCRGESLMQGLVALR